MPNQSPEAQKTIVALLVISDTRHQLFDDEQFVRKVIDMITAPRDLAVGIREVISQGRVVLLELFALHGVREV